MNAPATRLTDAQVDALSAAMRGAARPASNVSLHNYRFSMDNSRVMGVLRARDHPRKRLTTAATFGLAHEDWSDSNFPHRIELVTTWNTPSEEIEQLLIVVAETITMRRRLPKPGAIYEDAVKIAGLTELARTMPHALVLFPCVHKLGFNSVKLDGTKVWFMQVAPIYEDESAYIEREGFERFEELLEYDGAQFEDLSRASHIIKMP
jgi:hypothetical protein